MFRKLSRIIPVILSLGVLASALSASPALAAGGGRGHINGTDIQQFSGKLSADAPATVNFATGADDTGAILTLQASNGGDKTVVVSDSGGNFVETFWVPAGVSDPWSHY